MARPSFFRRFENKLLVRLLARFAINQIIANTSKSSELVDCATAIIDEVNNA